MRIAASHHLPDKNCGTGVDSYWRAEDWTAFLKETTALIAVYGHIHSMLPATGPGPADLPIPAYWSAILSRFGFASGLTVQYAILEIDDTGLPMLTFGVVMMGAVSFEIGSGAQLVYYEIWSESLVNGIHHTHNHDLPEISEREGYSDEIAAFLKSSRNSEVTPFLSYNKIKE